MSKATYCDFLFTGLVRCEVISTDGAKASVRLLEDRGAYRKGECVTVFRNKVVHKAGYRDGFVMVRNAL